MKEVAILGPTASGKTALSIEVAKEVGANILSLDSLSIYKEVDIVSAKPSLEEREGIKHFGIDEICLDQYFSAATFFDIYKRAKEESIKESKHLIIVGGSSFYLKALMDGLSPKIELKEEQKDHLDRIMLDLNHAYGVIEKLDPNYAKKIKSSDRYRISKWHEIYLATDMVASEFFKEHTRESIIKSIDIFEIAVDRSYLRERIKARTKQMIKSGLIDEVFYLEKKYTRAPNPMKAIGIAESLEYLDAKIDLSELEEKISIHTAQLAKRQQTFNKSQFPQKETLLIKDLRNKLLSLF